MDKAIGKNSFKVVTLLRLSPLLPLALSNYFYGLTSVDLGSYVAGSWLGMLPGTILYVIAGEFSFPSCYLLQNVCTLLLTVSSLFHILLPEQRHIDGLSFMKVVEPGKSFKNEL